MIQHQDPQLWLWLPPALMLLLFLVAFCLAFALHLLPRALWRLVRRAAR
jgi:hypothetical protein